eukprot:scaffold4703_cov108-Cylindrotheca_fusiformis.AAC.14
MLMGNPALSLTGRPVHGLHEDLIVTTTVHSIARFFFTSSNVSQQDVMRHTFQQIFREAMLSIEGGIEGGEITGRVLQKSTRNRC